MQIYRSFLRPALAAALAAILSTSALAMEVVGPNPRHVWQWDAETKSASLGRPDTDDVFLTLECKGNGVIEAVFTDYASDLGGKSPDGAGLTLRRYETKVAVDGDLRENNLSGQWDFVAHVSVDHPMMTLFQGVGIVDVEAEKRFQPPRGRKTRFSLENTRGAIDEIASACFVGKPMMSKAAAGKATGLDDFGRYATADGHRGKVVYPDFKGRDRDWSTFRTRIRKGMEGGADFAGRLAIIEIGCGAGCRLVAVGDVSTGQVHRFPLGGEDNMYLHLRYRRDSRLVAAHWQDGGRCMKESLEWTGRGFRQFGRADVGDEEVCIALQRE